MKARFCIGFATRFLLLALATSTIRTSSVDAANLQASAPRETWVSEYINTEPDVGSHVSITFDEDQNNTPWISYYDKTNESLNVAHFVGDGSGDCNANNDWICEEVDTGGVGQYSSIDIYPDVNPDPFQSTWKVGVSYYDATNRSLKYAQYACHSFICSWHIETVQSPNDALDPFDSVGKYSSLEFGLDGTAYISYYRSDPGNSSINEWLMYANDRVSIRSCGADDGWTCVDIAGDADAEIMNFGAHTSLSLDYQGNVWISYYGGKQSDLRLAFCDAGGNCDFSDEWEKWIIDNGGGNDTGLFTSLHAPKSSADVTSVAYYDKTAGKLMYAFFLGTSGNCGPNDDWRCTTIDSVGSNFAQVGISLAVSDFGMPMIAYMDGSDESAPLGLKVASPAYLQPYANCGSGYYTWYCRDVDNGGAYQEEAQYVALGLKPNGLAMITYSERDTYAYPEEYNLKLAYQLTTSLLPLVAK